MGIADAIMDRIFTELGIDKEKLKKITSVISILTEGVEITEDYDNLNIEVNPKKFNITIKK